jgi:hypothetical protein
MIDYFSLVRIPLLDGAPLHGGRKMPPDLV